MVAEPVEAEVTLLATLQNHRLRLDYSMKAVKAPNFKIPITILQTGFFSQIQM
jgi:hypothetical protein